MRIPAMASDRHPILEKFNVFDRFNIPENERPARKEEFREKMREEVAGGSLEQGPWSCAGHALGERCAGRPVVLVGQ
ncbi:MAG TPA: hypothetical protein VFI51_12235 [Bradyrhizobium sp.]|nr:hypothetical protein [Bradyrhizobium sp.]